MIDVKDKYHDLLLSFRKEANIYFDTMNKSKRADEWFFIKGAIYFSIFSVSYFLLFYTTSYFVFAVVYLFHGLTGFFLNLNLSHDAAHRAVFKKPHHNDLLYYVCFLLIGSSAWLWKKNHCTYHHPSPNVSGKDPDLIDTPLLRIHGDQKYRWFHRCQQFYAPLLYMLHAPLHYFFTENKIIISHEKMQIGDKLLAFAGKLFHLGYLLLIPAIFSPFSFGAVILLFLLLQMSISMVLVFGLGVSHLNDQVKFYSPASSDPPVAIQLHSSLDYGAQCRVTHFLTGGFNLHGLHHLVPDICHTHYYSLVPAFMALTRKYDIPYTSVAYPQILKSHFKLLSKMSKPPKYEQ